MRSPFTTAELKEKRLEAIRLRDNHVLTDSQIARALGVARGTVQHWLKGAIHPRRRGERLENKTGIVAQIRNLRLAGYSFMEISRDLNISSTTARRLHAQSNYGMAAVV